MNKEELENIQQLLYINEGIVKRIRNYEKMIISLKLYDYFQKDLEDVDVNYELKSCDSNDFNECHDFLMNQYNELINHWEYLQNIIAKLYVPEFLFENASPEIQEKIKEANKIIEEKRQIFIEKD